MEWCGHTCAPPHPPRRCIAGLWTPDAGLIRRPELTGRDGVVFMPQRPYMASGTLRQQVIYPSVESEVGAPAQPHTLPTRHNVPLHSSFLVPSSHCGVRAHFDIACFAVQVGVEDDDILTQLLTDFGLGEILADWGLDGVAVWEDVLSAGEQQRISFTRVVYSQPRLVVMDEATSTLDLQNEVRQHAQSARTHSHMRMLTRALHPSPPPRLRRSIRRRCACNACSTRRLQS